MPLGWLHGHRRLIVTVPFAGPAGDNVEMLNRVFETFWLGEPENFYSWIIERTANQCHPFEVAVRDEDLEFLKEFAGKQKTLRSNR
jgi:hypothetical protein